MDNDVNFLPGSKKPVKKKKEEDIEKIEWTNPVLEIEKLKLDKDKKDSGFNWFGIFGKPKSVPSPKKPVTAEETVKPQIDNSKSNTANNVVFEKEEKRITPPPAKKKINENELDFFSSPRLKGTNDDDKPKQKKIAEKPQPFYSENIAEKKGSAVPEKRPSSREPFDLFSSWGLFKKKKPKTESFQSTDSELLDGDKEMGVNLLEGNLKIEKDQARKKSIKSSSKMSEITDSIWDNPNIIETNLIKEQSLAFFDWKKIATSLGFSLLSACMIVAMVYGALITWERYSLKNDQSETKIKNIDKAINDLSKEIQNENIMEKDKKLTVIKTLLENHIYWTNFFTFLEKNTLETVFFADFSGATAGSYELTAFARDLRSVAEQIEFFGSLKPLVLTAQTSGASTAGPSPRKNLSDKDNKKDAVGYVSFKLKLVLDPKIFKEYKESNSKTDQ